MQRLDKQYLESVRREWTQGGGVRQLGIVQKGHAKINEWVWELLSKEEFTDEEVYFVNYIYHGMNCDIPPSATHWIREEIVHAIQMKMEDPNWDPFGAD